MGSRKRRKLKVPKVPTFVCSLHGRGVESAEGKCTTPHPYTGLECGRDVVIRYEPEGQRPTQE